VRPSFEELDRQQTTIGEISLRWRLEPSLQVDVYEAKLDDEFLMSSLFTASEVALGELGLAALPGDDLDIVVGGLGLGYTAHAVLADPRVRSLRVVELLEPVIGWHERHLLPLSESLTADPRCQFVHADFFATVAAGTGFGPAAPARHHAILVDIDHTPGNVLDASHQSFYSSAGLQRVVEQLHPGGVFGLWSDDPPDDDVLTTIEQVFGSCESHIVSFPNPYTDTDSACTVYVARLVEGEPGFLQPPSAAGFTSGGSGELV
jgi:spermidine synthase